MIRLIGKIKSILRTFLSCMIHGLLASTMDVNSASSRNSRLMSNSTVAPRQTVMPGEAWDRVLYPSLCRSDDAPYEIVPSTVIGIVVKRTIFEKRTAEVSPKHDRKLLERTADSRRRVASSCTRDHPHSLTQAVYLN